MNEMMKTGIEIMQVGMGAVFIFLTLLIGIVVILARTIQHYAPPVLENKTAAATARPPDDVIAAIVGGIQAYRQKKQR